jgi:tetratricopeptide (TPR) repeat protein
MAMIAERLTAAVRSHQAGRLDEAEAQYRGILREEPRQAHALHLLGVVAHQTGRHSLAIDLIGQALVIHGPHPIFHTNLAAAYLALGRYAEAATQCREALRLQPNLADAHNNLGAALRGLGQFDEAEGAFREAVRLNPRDGEARRNLGAILHRQGKLPEALLHLQDAVARAPGSAQARNDLGGLLIDCGQPEQAAQHLREAIRLKPDLAAAHNNLGVALENLDQVEGAMQCFQEALRLQPTYASAHGNLGAAWKAQGKVPEALAEFLEALRLEPNNVTALANLSKLAAVGRYTFSEQQLERLKERAARTDSPLDTRCRLHFILARVADQAGAYEEAFEQCRLGNELRAELYRRRGVVFDAAAHRQLVDHLITTFTPAWFERARSFGLDSELPIFIVGMPRSGTTLAEQILASHPQIHGAGELPDVEKLVDDLPRRLGATESYPACLARLDAATARALADEQLQRLRQRGGAAVRVIDKLPFNFLHLGVIATLFPRAKLIHCRRDPVDTCLSCFFQNFAVPHPFTLGLRPLGQYYREHERLMAHWQQVLPLTIFDLQYEELTQDQEAMSRRLVAFCGLDWDERCLRFFENQRVVRTASTLEVRQPMYRSSVGRWKRYEAHLQPLLEALRESAPVEKPSGLP